MSYDSTKGKGAEPGPGAEGILIQAGEYQEMIPMSTPTPKPDMVNHPPHYNSGKIEVITIMEDQLSPEEYRGYIKGQVLKYITREHHKNGLEDLKKAQWYLNRLIKYMEEKQND